MCGLAWHPSGSQIAYTDTEGCLGLLDGLSTSTSNTTTTSTTKVQLHSSPFKFSSIVLLKSLNRL